MNKKKQKTVACKVPTLHDIIVTTFKNSSKQFQATKQQFEVEDRVLARMKGYPSVAANSVNGFEIRSGLIAYVLYVADIPIKLNGFQTHTTDGQMALMKIRSLFDEDSISNFHQPHIT